MNFTSTRWPIRNGAASAETTTSTTRSSVLSEGSSDWSLRAPKISDRRRTLPTKTLVSSASGVSSASWPMSTEGRAASAISARTMRAVSGSRSNMSDTFRVEAPAPGLA